MKITVQEMLNLGNLIDRAVSMNDYEAAMKVCHIISELDSGDETQIDALTKLLLKEDTAEMKS